MEKHSSFIVVKGSQGRFTEYTEVVFKNGYSENTQRLQDRQQL